MIRGASTLLALLAFAASSVSCAPGPWVPPPSEPAPASGDEPAPERGRPADARLDRSGVSDAFAADEEPRASHPPVANAGAARFALAMPLTPPPPRPEIDPDAAERPEPGAWGASAEPASPAPSPDPPPSTPAPPRYSTSGAISLAPDVARRIADVAEAFHRRTNKELVLTSGTRDAARQADAMVEAMRLGADVVRLYRDKSAAREIREAFDRARAERLPPRDVVARVEATIRDQIARGTYVSAHLRAGAVDVRSRGMSAVDRATFVAAARAAGFSVLEETAPPHFHLQLGE